MIARSGIHTALFGVTGRAQRHHIKPMLFGVSFVVVVVDGLLSALHAILSADMRNVALLRRVVNRNSGTLPVRVFLPSLFVVFVTFVFVVLPVLTRIFPNTVGVIFVPVSKTLGLAWLAGIGVAVSMPNMAVEFGQLLNLAALGALLALSAFYSLPLFFWDSSPLFRNAPMPLSGFLIKSFPVFLTVLLAPFGCTIFTGRTPAAAFLPIAVVLTFFFPLSTLTALLHIASKTNSPLTCPESASKRVRQRAADWILSILNFRAKTHLLARPIIAQLV